MIPNVFAQPSPTLVSYGNASAPVVAAPTLSAPGNVNILGLVDNVAGGSDNIKLYVSDQQATPTGWSFSNLLIAGNFPLDVTAIGRGGASYWYYATAVKGGTESAPSNAVQTNGA